MTDTRIDVVTYDSLHARTSICADCAGALRAKHDWLRDTTGEQMVDVYRGYHLGHCDVCDRG